MQDIQAADIMSFDISFGIIVTHLDSNEFHIDFYLDSNEVISAYSTKPIAHLSLGEGEEAGTNGLH